MTKQRYFAMAVLALLVVATYVNSLSGVFVFDDLPAIRDNPTIRTLSAWSDVLSPPRDSGVGGRPIANLSFALNRAIGGASVTSYHVGNVLLHLAVTFLLFGIVRRTLMLDSGADERSSVALAFVIAAIWGVHPLTTAAVSYLSQRTELLMGCFYLLSLFAFVRAVTERRSRWLGVSVGACALGMLSKEVMVTAPFVIWFYDRTFVAGTFGEALRRRWKYYLGLAATWGLLGWVLTSELSQRSVGYGLGVSAFDYALMEARAILLYLRLAVWPMPLVFDYGPVYEAGVASAIAVVLLLAGVIWLMVRRSKLGFVAAVFFVLLSPTSSVVPVAEQPIAENRMYLPLAAIVVLAVCVARCAIHRFTSRTNKTADGFVVRPMGFGVVIAGMVVTGFVVLTIHRNTLYRSALALWSDTAMKRPQNWRAQFNHGVSLLDLGRASEAAGAFERTIQLRPREAKAHNSLGNALMAMDRVPDAAARFAEAVRLQPSNARTWYNWGTAVFRQGEVRAAIERFEHALKLEPKLADAEIALGNAWFQSNEPARAVLAYEAALRIDPSLADAHYNGGSACLELGRIDDAIAHFDAAARLKPDDVEIRNNLGAALVRGGRLAEGIAAFEHALRLKPDYADARDNLELARQATNRTK